VLASGRPREYIPKRSFILTTALNHFKLSWQNVIKSSGETSLAEHWQHSRKSATLLQKRGNQFHLRGLSVNETFPLCQLRNTNLRSKHFYY